MSDEIEQLRTEVARQRQRRIDATMALSAADALANTLRALVAEQHEELVRLRAAGDAMAEDMGDSPWAHLHIAAWQEARNA